jgi:hypothetical protein
MINETQLEFGRALRDVGIETVLDHTPETYREKADNAILALAKKGWKFSAEDVRELAGDPPNHCNAMGAIMNSAIRAGIIQVVGYGKATRSKSHARNIQFYMGVTDNLVILKSDMGKVIDIEGDVRSDRDP